MSKCLVIECEKKQFSRGYCHNHAYNLPFGYKLLPKKTIKGRKLAPRVTRVFTTKDQIEILDSDKPVILNVADKLEMKFDKLEHAIRFIDLFVLKNYSIALSGILDITSSVTEGFVTQHLNAIRKLSEVIEFFDKRRERVDDAEFMSTVRARAAAEAYEEHLQRRVTHE